MRAFHCKEIGALAEYGIVLIFSRMPGYITITVLTFYQLPLSALSMSVCLCDKKKSSAQLATLPLLCVELYISTSMFKGIHSHTYLCLKKTSNCALKFVLGFKKYFIVAPLQKEPGWLPRVCLSVFLDLFLISLGSRDQIKARILGLTVWCRDFLFVNHSAHHPERWPIAIPLCCTVNGFLSHLACPF